MLILNTKKLNDVEVKMPNWFVALENMDNNADINRDRESMSIKIQCKSFG
jgi:hypothetical protein